LHRPDLTVTRGALGSGRWCRSTSCCAHGSTGSQQTSAASISSTPTKLLGVYEAEIQPWIGAEIARRPPVFVDVGAANGYYAIGFARASPQTDVIAFELSREARNELRGLVAINQVQLTVRGRATTEAVAELPLDRALVLSDVEGFEADLFSASLVEGSAQRRSSWSSTRPSAPV
jgi:hypothetical protein